MKVMDEPPVSKESHQSGQPPVVYYLQPAPPEPEDDEIDLRAFWRIIRDAWGWILALTLLATALAAGLALSMTPVYRAEVVMAPVEEGKGGGLAALAGQFGGLASLAGIELGGGGGRTEEALAILKSRRFTEQFIEERGLMPVLFEDIWDPASGTWQLEPGEEPPTLWDGVKAFDEIRSVSTDKKSGLVTLSIEWRDPAQAAEWANDLVARVNRHIQAQAVSEAQRNIDYLREQLQNTDMVEMQQAMYRLIEAQTKNIMLAKVRDEYVFKVIDPAVPPDPDEPIKPKRTLMVVVGFVLGLMLGVILAVVRAALRDDRESAVQGSAS